MVSRSFPIMSPMGAPALYPRLFSSADSCPLITAKPRYAQLPAMPTRLLCLLCLNEPELPT
jgi:hypothetical protein